MIYFVEVWTCRIIISGYGIWRKVGKVEINIREKLRIWFIL